MTSPESGGTVRGSVPSAECAHGIVIHHEGYCGIIGTITSMGPRFPYTVNYNSSKSNGGNHVTAMVSPPAGSADFLWIRYRNDGGLPTYVAVFAPDARPTGPVRAGCSPGPDAPGPGMAGFVRPLPLATEGRPRSRCRRTFAPALWPRPVVSSAGIALAILPTAEREGP
jgi:hypothetical protein